MEIEYHDGGDDMSAVEEWTERRLFVATTSEANALADAAIAELEERVLQLKDKVGDEWARAEQAMARIAELEAENDDLKAIITDQEHDIDAERIKRDGAKDETAARDAIVAHVGTEAWEEAKYLAREEADDALHVRHLTAEEMDHE